jgi:phosphoglucosamine mutase
MTSSSLRQLFGTDGIRGIAGEFPLNLESTYLIGRAIGHDLAKSCAENSKPSVVIGQDTRESSGWIADQVSSGLASTGIEVHSAGIITTPGVAYLARSRKHAAGIVISASHNPWTDNGIKVFSGDGYKLPDSHELAIEQEIFALLNSGKVLHAEGKGASSLPGESALRSAYIEWLANGVHIDLSGLKVLVDCANGAATAEAPELFRECRVRATYLSAQPDGKNINHHCGALHPETLAAEIKKTPSEFDLGVTFDGDADRALFSDAEGRVVNGDAILLLAARDMQSRGALPGSKIVATTMSNMGLEVALRASGISMLRANVGDKYVLEEMIRSGAILGGEQSGHIIFRDGEATTGDGLLTALRVMEIVARAKRSLADMLADLKVFPQTIINIRVREKVPFTRVPEIQNAIESAETELAGNGRVVVRYSGTEALARVMVEAASEDQMRALAHNIADAIRRALGRDEPVAAV